MYCGLCGGNYNAYFYQLDTNAIATGPGYNRLLTEPALVSAGANDRLGQAARVETEYIVRVAYEARSSDRLQQMPGGKQRGARLEITALWEELNSAGLIDPSGRPMIRTGARLSKITNLDGSLVEEYPDPPGMYVDEILQEPGFRGSYHTTTWMVTPRKQG